VERGSRRCFRRPARRLEGGGYRRALQRSSTRPVDHANACFRSCPMWWDADQASSAPLPRAKITGCSFPSWQVADSWRDSTPLDGKQLHQTARRRWPNGEAGSPWIEGFWAWRTNAACIRAGRGVRPTVLAGFLADRVSRRSHVAECRAVEFSPDVRAFTAPFGGLSSSHRAALDARAPLAADAGTSTR
jgi:hypothetical protein